MANRVILSPGYFPNPLRSGSISGGSIYVGIVDLDPKIVGNQKQISVLQENGTTIPVAQPIETNKGGTPQYNGSPVTILVDGSYSLRVDDKHGAQVYYAPANAESTDDNITIKTISDLRNKVGDFENQSANLLGYYDPGDGGGGVFIWDATSILADDNGRIIAPTSNPITGRWIRQGTLGSFLYYGAKSDLTFNSTEAIRSTMENYTVIQDNGGTYRMEDTILWNKSRIAGAKGFSTAIFWYGAVGGIMFETTQADQMISASNVNFTGRFVAKTLIKTIGTGAVRQQNFDSCMFLSATDEALLIGNFTTDGLDADIAPITIDKCMFYDNRIGIVVDSLNALLITVDNSEITQLTNGKVEECIFLKRGGSVRANNTYFGAQPPLGDKYAVRVIDGWVTLDQCEVEWGQGGGGGGMLLLEAPVVSAGLGSRGDHVSAITNTRILAPGVTGSGTVVRVESVKHSLNLIGNGFHGKSVLTLPTIANVEKSSIMSIGNNYTGRPFESESARQNIITLGDSFFDGTNTVQMGSITNHYTNLNTINLPYQATYNNELINLGNSGIVLTLPPAIGVTTGLYQPTTKRITVSQSHITTTNTIVPFAGDTIEGSATPLLFNQFKSVILESDGAFNWKIVAYYNPAHIVGANTGIATVKMGNNVAATNAGWVEVSAGKFVPYWTDPTP
jgi:hypothetical protein